MAMEARESASVTIDLLYCGVGASVARMRGHNGKRELPHLLPTRNQRRGTAADTALKRLLRRVAESNVLGDEDTPCQGFLNREDKFIADSGLNHIRLCPGRKASFHQLAVGVNGQEDDA